MYKNIKKLWENEVDNAKKNNTKPSFSKPFLKLGLKFMCKFGFMGVSSKHIW